MNTSYEAEIEKWKDLVVDLTQEKYEAEVERDKAQAELRKIRMTKETAEGVGANVCT